MDITLSDTGNHWRALSREKGDKWGHEMGDSRERLVGSGF